jgi:hypothetical protein
LQTCFDHRCHRLAASQCSSKSLEKKSTIASENAAKKKVLDRRRNKKPNESTGAGVIQGTDLSRTELWIGKTSIFL